MGHTQAHGESSGEFWLLPLSRHRADLCDECASLQESSILRDRPHQKENRCCVGGPHLVEDHHEMGTELMAHRYATGPSSWPPIILRPLDYWSWRSSIDGNPLLVDEACGRLRRYRYVRVLRGRSSECYRIHQDSQVRTLRLSMAAPWDCCLGYRFLQLLDDLCRP